MLDDRTISVREDYSGSGRVTQVLRGDVLIWAWPWHIDGPPNEETLSLLRAIGRPTTMADEPPFISAQEAHDLAVELRDKGDALVALCSQISGIPFDPDDTDELSLDEWFAAALAVLESWRGDA